ncbi:tryptophan 7-halogenase [Erythrobacteraceae bacterium CFH 75059]|uniref:tryptophan halogenase family protein n=1 Tax=Qipengyuania thermophila TaxID=2509361 RepID=UPI001020B6BE|nr:tryptophan halogenase family protein [Qipengyuania thermophila]TCD05248.1 tryptophan 7-halogenase [Erythrobacteraceae bacterium CFH 75059]
MTDGVRAPDCVVLGGGSAGWIAACLLHQAFAGRGATVTLVENPEIGIIGVGEGSTPQLKAFFDRLGVDEAEWMAACDATFKLGIRFHGWSKRPGFSHYIHPFPSPVDLHTEPPYTRVCAAARRGAAVDFAHPDDWFLASRLALAGLSPHAADSFPFAPSHGYHFDAYKLGAYLRGWATSRGVRHVRAEVAAVECAGDERIGALVCADGTRLTADMFVDCSGFRSELMQKTLGEPFIAFDDNLFVDRAVVMATPPPGQATPLTEAIAMRAGWRWRIPLQSRCGNGYVYSSAFVSDDEAEHELRQALGMLSAGETRRLRMKVGRVRQSWRGNCLAVGLAQGFIEPLEATALHIVIHTVERFIAAWAPDAGPDRLRAFNEAVATRYDGIRDYIVAHYRLNQREGNFWRANASNHSLSEPLKQVITAWFTHADLRQRLAEIYGPHSAYSSASWHCLFAGYGTFPTRPQPVPHDMTMAGEALATVQTMLAACARNFGPLEAS